MRRSLLTSSAAAVVLRLFSSAAASFEMSEILKVKKLSEFASIPVRGSEFAAGYDLCAATDASVPSKGKALVMTDLSIEIPPNTYARIAPRSGLTWKNFLDTGAGVIDYDYRGNVGVILFNHSDKDFEIKCGDRIAQMILERISMAPCVEVEELGTTQRGEGGFGSTGVSSKKAKTDNIPSSASFNLILVFILCNLPNFIM
jgi:dUTP pyrophosphatase